MILCFIIKCVKCTILKVTYNTYIHTVQNRIIEELPLLKIRDEDPDPLIFGLPDPDPLLFLTDPDPDLTCNNGYIKLFSS